MFGLFERKSAPIAHDESVRILQAIDFGVSGGSSINMSPEKALSVMAVFASVRVISEDVAKLPAKLKRQVDDSSTSASDQPEHIILSRMGKASNDADDGFTAMEWIEAIVASAALYGIGVAHLNRVSGTVREVTPIKNGNWRLRRGQWMVKWRDENWEVVDRRELMVLRGPQLGISISQNAAQAIDLAQKIDAMMTSLAKKAGRPNGILSSDTLTSQEKVKSFTDRIKTYFGISGQGGLMPIDLGQLHYIRLSLTPEELQQDATYARTVNQIASAFRVQPSRLMHAITEHNNASLYSSNATHVQDCIQPWTKRFRQSFDKDVLGESRIGQGYYCDIALQGLLQGAPAERSQLYMALRTVGAMSPLTVARLEDLPTDNVSDQPSFPLLTNPNPSEEKTQLKDANNE